MKTHRALAGLAAAAVALAGWSAAQDTTGRSAGKGDAAHKQRYWDCAKACDDCGRMCDACGAHCTDLVAQGHKEHLETLKTCQDCADVCRAAAAVTARTGPFTSAICTACADACKGCGDACERHGEHDPIMKRCAEECRKCEQACRDMLKHTGHRPGTGAQAK
jgi:hypothetical protein